MLGSTPKAPRCLNCARPMQLSRKTLRYGALPDLYSFCCLACDEWHVEEGEAVRTGPRLTRCSALNSCSPQIMARNLPRLHRALQR
jgi:hypothetical protein